MNKTPIDWADFTWNIVTGCLHGCPYCYARRITQRFAPCEGNDPYFHLADTDTAAIREYLAHGAGKVDKGVFPYGFKPTFYANRLDEPKKLRKPSRIFVVSMGDLFGEWVPRSWIDAVLKVVAESPKHTFIFLTKNPRRYSEFIFPSNAWVGTTVTSASDLHRADHLENVKGAGVRYLSVEPILGPLALPKFLDWTIVGAMTGPKSVIPQKEWVDNIVADARRMGIPLFVKRNVPYPCSITEFPEKGDSSWSSGL